jgi:tRNA(Ile)-lysidine synthase
MTLLARVRAFVRQHDLAGPHSRVAAAVSGGSDSMALAQLLAELARAGDLQFCGIVHFNHQLRAEADADERFVRDAARALDVPIVAGREDVATRAARDRQSLENAGRTARHAFFARAMRELNVDAIALGHTRDDQAETFLLRLLRGAGPRGLAAMHPRVDGDARIIRPLLDATRAELAAFLTERGVAHVEDATNADVSIPRNPVRAELLPLLAARFNPAIVDVLADEAALARELWGWMEDACAPFLATPGVLDAAALRAAPPALRRLVLWRALTAAAAGRHISFDHVAAVIRLIQAAHDGALDLPGHTVQRIGTRIVLQNRRGRSGRQPANLFRMPLSIPGEAVAAQAGWTVTAQHGTAAAAAAHERGAITGNGPLAIVRGDLINGSLGVRNRRPGDRFHPVGLGGSKKLQDLFVDRKLARQERDAVPLVVDENDRIVWVAGYGIDEAFRVTDASQAVLVLKLTRS